jgi:predicted PurR-regulated permease PerM
VGTDPSGFFLTVLFLFFLLVHGDTFLRRVVEILPRFSNKRQAVDISQKIESDISAYLITITIMNAVVGTATAIVMWYTGLGDPILWGTVAFLLNYVPIVGPACGVAIFLLAGLLTIDTLWQAFLPAVLYLGIHFAEGELITPTLLAKRFTLNPVTPLDCRCAHPAFRWEHTQPSTHRRDLRRPRYGLSGLGSGRPWWRL